METSIIIARIFATVYFSFGVGLLISPTYYQEHITKLLTNAGFIALSGFLAIVFGVIITTTHHYWENDWRMIITIFGWVALIKGILLIIAPMHIDTLKYNLLHPKNYKKNIAPILLALGLLFGYFGFIH